MNLINMQTISTLIQIAMASSIFHHIIRLLLKSLSHLSGFKVGSYAEQPNSFRWVAYIKKLLQALENKSKLELNFKKEV